MKILKTNKKYIIFSFIAIFIGISCAKKNKSEDRPNHSPIADAGRDVNVKIQTTAKLNGSNSYDIDGNILTFVWKFMSRPETSQTALDNVTLTNPEFTPDLVGPYIIELKVNDKHTDSEPDYVMVTASEGNSLPVANAGEDRRVAINKEVQVDGSNSSDADSNSLTYKWWFEAKPKDSKSIFDDATAIKPKFTPDVDGDYILNLVVTDQNNGKSLPDFVIYTASGDFSSPLANAGTDQGVVVGVEVALNGSGSVNTNDEPLGYRWVLRSRPDGSNISLNDYGAEKPTFTPDLIGDYIFALTVFNGGGESKNTDTVVITVSERVAKLAWEHDLVNASGDAIPLESIGGFKVYYGESSGSYYNSKDISIVHCSKVSEEEATCLYNLTDLKIEPTYYFVVTAYTASGQESGYSNEASQAPITN